MHRSQSLRDVGGGGNGSFLIAVAFAKFPDRLRAYSVRVEGAKYGASFRSALAIAISYTTNHSILWAIHGVLSWLYVIYFALFQA